MQWQALARNIGDGQTRFGGTKLQPHARLEHHSASRATRRDRPGPEPRHHPRPHQDPRRRRDRRTCSCCCARSRATPAPTCSRRRRAHPRQRGGEDRRSARTCPSSPAATRRRAGSAAEPVPDHRAPGHRASRSSHAADRRRRRGEARALPGGVERHARQALMPADIITNKRSLESTVLVDDGQIVVLGGLIQDDVQPARRTRCRCWATSRARRALPYETRNRKRTNLMVFLRPVVLRDESARLAHRRPLRLHPRHPGPGPAARSVPAAADARPAAARAAAAARRPAPDAAARGSGAAAGAPSRPLPAAIVAVAMSTQDPDTVFAAQLDRGFVRRCPIPSPRRRACSPRAWLTDALEVWIRPYPQASTLAEVRRMAGKPLRDVLLTPEEFEHRLALAYTREPSAAETIVEDMGDSVDLAEPHRAAARSRRPPRAENDAPIIRLINALLTQAVRERRLRRPPRDLRGALAGALPRRRRAARRGRAARAACTPRWSRASRSWPRSTSPRSACRRTGASRCASPGARSTCASPRIPTAHGERVVLRLLDKQAGPAHARLRSAWRRRRAPRVDAPDPAAARHRARHRPDGLGQDDHAVRGAVAARPQDAQHPHRRGPDRVRARRHRPDARSTRASR